MRALLAAIILALLPSIATAQNKQDFSFTPPRASGVYTFQVDGYTIEVPTGSRLWISIGGITVGIDEMPASEIKETCRILLAESRRLERINRRRLPDIRENLRTVQGIGWLDGVTAYVEILGQSRIATAMHQSLLEFQRLGTDRLAIEDARTHLENMMTAFSRQVLALLSAELRVQEIELSIKARPQEKKRPAA